MGGLKKASWSEKGFGFVFGPEWKWKTGMAEDTMTMMR